MTWVPRFHSIWSGQRRRRRTAISDAVDRVLLDPEAEPGQGVDVGEDLGRIGAEGGPGDELAPGLADLVEQGMFSGVMRGASP